MTTMRWVSRISVGSGNGSGSPTPSMIDTVSAYNNIKYKCVRKGCIDEEVKEKKASSLSMSRREAIGSVCGFGIVNGFMYTQPPEGCASASDSNECEFKVAPSGLEFCDKVVGEGDEAVKGQLIKAHYVGKLESGKVFDSSYNRGKPLTFRIGVGEVIKGWDQGILGGDGVPPMLPGGKRVLKLPPQLGYGARGAGCRGGSCIIPPDSILLFDVEFIGNP